MTFSLQIDNQFIANLPADLNQQPMPRRVDNACFSYVTPAKVQRPQLICFSRSVATQIGLSEADCRSELFSQVFSGNQLLEGTRPYSMCYGGHQFGQWAGQLGDGRAINLAEVIDQNRQRQTLQLKGAGLTPYSRSADGLAVLRSSVREFLCSEAMHNLGVPTTRALSLILTGEEVLRDMFYDGNAKLEPGAIVCRVAPSFVRFGSFELFAARKQHKELKQLMDYCIDADFPSLNCKGDKNAQDYERWFDRICSLTAELMVEWTRVGFVHGVMNTDNLSILGLTIDYGPYGWIDHYDPEWTPNTTDAQNRRYCFANQPQIALWNLFQLANAIAPVVGRVQALEKSLERYSGYYQTLSNKMYAAKLGLTESNADNHEKLVQQLFENMQLTETDMTIFFRQLSTLEKNKVYQKDELLQLISCAFYRPDAICTDTFAKINDWMCLYQKEIQSQAMSDSERKQSMDKVNPKYILRNYLAQQAIEKAEAGDFSEIETLLNLVQNPYSEQPEFNQYAAKRPDWARTKPGASMLSCSS